MRKYLLALSVLVFLGFGAHQIYAEAPSAKPASLLEQKKQKYAAKQAEWAKLTKEQKLKTLNDRQAKKVKSMQDRWAKLTDEQKIARYESGMKRGQEMSLKAAEYRQKCDELIGLAN